MDSLLFARAGAAGILNNLALGGSWGHVHEAPESTIPSLFTMVPDEHNRQLALLKYFAHSVFASALTGRALTDRALNVRNNYK